MAWYSTGTVAVTNNSTTVTGTGTAFDANARVGDAFQGPDGAWYEVTNITSVTVLSIKPAYKGATASGAAYSIAPMQGYVKASADTLRGFVNSYGTALASLGPAATWQPGQALVLSGTGSRLQADFSNATLASRFLFQSTTTNGASSVGVIPNGTSATSDVSVYSAADPTNSVQGRLQTDGAAVRLASSANGTASVVPVVFSVGGTDRMRVDASGNVILLNAAARIQGDFSNGTLSNRVQFQTSTANSATYPGIVPNGTATEAGLTIHNNSNASTSSYLNAFVTASAIVFRAQRSSGSYPLLPITFQHDASERLRIETTGQVLMHTTDSTGLASGASVNPGQQFTTTGAIASQANTEANLYLAKGSGYTNGSLALFYATGSAVGSILTTGSATSFNTTSDARVKTDVKTLEDARVYIAATNPVTHKWDTQRYPDLDQSLPTAGFIAHELQEVFPQAVTGEKDAMEDIGSLYETVGTEEVLRSENVPEPVDLAEGQRWEKTGEQMKLQQVDTSKLIPLLVSALKAEMADNETARATIAEQAEQITAILARLDALETAGATPAAEAETPAE